VSLSPELTISDRYMLVERIAVGGMGEVWRARDQLLDRDVAIKVLKDEYAEDPTFLQRFRSEAKHTASLSHPGIANVFDYGEVGAVAYLVMELVPGEPLSALIARDAPLPPSVVMNMLGQAGLALQAAHEVGVVHRDVKPGNHIVRPDGVVKVTDFGIARAVDAAPVTQTGLLVGTAAYLSPEQAAGRAATAASDIYSLGIVGYECLAGHRPFTGDSAIGVAMSHLNTQPPALPDSVPPLVADFVMRALDKEPSRRQPSAGDFGRTALALATQIDEPRTQESQPPATSVSTPGPTATAIMTQLPVTDDDATVADSDAPVAPVDDDHQRRRIRNIFIAIGAAVVLLGFLLLRSCASGGGDTATVPKLVGRSYTEAAQVLHNRGFEVRRVGVHRLHAPVGTVVDQSVKRGTEATVGSVVTLDVSTGPRSVTIDSADYIGRPVADVQSELTDKQLNVVLLSLPSETPAGTVIAVEPTGTVQEGATVTVTVAAPPEHGHTKPPKGHKPPPKKDEHGG
jgi:serine/threonine-protein kinase